MGLKNAPRFFQPMIEEVFFSQHPELGEFVSVYIDDIIVATVGDGLTEQELVDLHEKRLNIVLNILDKNQLICGPKKGKLFYGNCRNLWQFAAKWDTPVQAQNREAPRHAEVEAP